MTWTSNKDLRAQVQRLWDKGELLATLLDEHDIFPRRLTLTKPSSTDFSEHFPRVRDWVRDLRSFSGLRIEFKTVNHPTLGRNDIPASAWLDSLDQAASLLGTGNDVKRFQRQIEETRRRQPQLLTWLQRYPIKALALAEDWSRLLDVVGYLQQQPRPGIYIRQLDLPGVDTKFIEGHRGVLASLLDLSLDPRHIRDDATGAARFDERYGFKTKIPRVRFRLLDPKARLLPGNDQDFTLSRDDLCQLGDSGKLAAITCAVITENEINYLSLPPLANTLAIFGAGYGFDALANIPWLAALDIHYWGDIDTHGFAILDQLRAGFPKAKSLLMDSETFFAHSAHWTQEPSRQRRELKRLTPTEAALYSELRENRHGDSLRLEQERVGFGWLEAELARIAL